MPANVARLLNHTKQARDGVNKKVFVQLGAALKVSSSRKNTGNIEDDMKKASARYYTSGKRGRNPPKVNEEVHGKTGGREIVS